MFPCGALIENCCTGQLSRSLHSKTTLQSTSPFTLWFIILMNLSPNADQMPSPSVPKYLNLPFQSKC